MKDWNKKLAQDLDLRGFSERTKDSYRSQVRRFMAVQQCDVDDLTEEHVRAWFLGLREGGYAPASLAVGHAALKFFFDVSRQRPDVMHGLPRPRVAKQPLGIPLTREEARPLLRALGDTPQFYAIIATVLGSGMRISEVTRVGIRDIDSANGLVHIRNGKGGKLRSVGLSPRLLRVLRRYWAVMRPESRTWLFPSRRYAPFGRPTHPIVWKADEPVSVDIVRRRLARAAKRVGLTRTVTPHDLRRSYATWLLESGVDLRVVQTLLGHASPETTARYTYIRPEFLKRLPSGLDLL